jgi:hypothetical protein
MINEAIQAFFSALFVKFLTTNPYFPSKYALLYEMVLPRADVTIAVSANIFVIRLTVPNSSIFISRPKKALYKKFEKFAVREAITNTPPENQPWDIADLSFFYAVVC